MCPTGSSLRRATISGEATSDFRGAFTVIDVDNDGKISNEDLRSFYTSISSTSSDDDDDNNNNNNTEEMIKAMMTVADADKDGYVEYDEFEKVLKEKSSSKKGKEKSSSYNEEVGGGGIMEEVFKVMDKDGDGRLGVDDLKSFLSYAGIVLQDDDDEVNAMIKLGCGDDGDVREGVSFQGFLNIFNVQDLGSY